VYLIKKRVKKTEINGKQTSVLDPGNIFFILIAEFFGNQRIRI
jgi:hypothetical protein